MKKNKNFVYYSNLEYPITISRKIDKENTYFEAEIPDLTGCRASGNTIDEALENLNEAKKVWLKLSLKKKLHIPEPESEDEYSGRILLRIPAKLHMNLSIKAKKEGLSLNQYMRKTLEQNITFRDLMNRMEAVEQEIGSLKNRIEVSEELTFTKADTETAHIVWGKGYTNTADDDAMQISALMNLQIEDEPYATNVLKWRSK